MTIKLNVVLLVLGRYTECLTHANAVDSQGYNNKLCHNTHSASLFYRSYSKCVDRNIPDLNETSSHKSPAVGPEPGAASTMSKSLIYLTRTNNARVLNPRDPTITLFFVILQTF